MKDTRSYFPILSLLILLLLVFGSFANVWAQSIVSGDVTGTITDPSGAVLPNVPVTIKGIATGISRSTTTNQSGFYRFSLLQPGNYQITATPTGFTTISRAVVVNNGQTTAANMQAQVGAASTTVEVTAEAPILQTDSGNITTAITPEQIAALPAPGGDITAFAFSSPGVTLNTGAGYGNFSTNGLPSTSNLFTVNGNDNMDPYLNLNNSGASNLSLGQNELSDAVVVNNGYTGQYGRMAGSQVNYTTKSGTNNYHGNASYWWNGRYVNANEWFLNNSGSPRPFANSNQWAASFGGPIKKDKLFFFADQEGLRYVLPGSSSPVYVPDAAFSSYILSTIPAAQRPFYQNIFNLYAGTPRYNTRTPVTAATDPALGCGDFAGKAAGLGTTTPCSDVLFNSPNNLNTEWLLTTRIDYNISSADRLNGRFRTDHGVQATGTDAINPLFNANSNQPEYEGQITETHNFGQTMVNQFIVSGMWYQALFGPSNIPAALAAFPTTMLFNDGLMQSLGGDASRGEGLNAFPQGRNVTQYGIVDDFSKSRGNHNFKVGINFRRNLVSDYSYGVNTSGLLSINSMTDFATGTLVNGSDFSKSFASVAQQQIKLHSFGIYGQDQWKVSPKLTLTLALRLDENGNPGCKANCFSRPATSFEAMNHDPAVPYNQVLLTGLSNAFPSYENLVWQPRIGAAYSISNKTVLRGGIGYFSDLFPSVITSRLITNAPNVNTFVATSGTIGTGPGSIFNNVAAANAAFTTGYATGGTLASISSAVAATGATFSPPNMDVMNSKILNPKFLQWNFEIEQQVGTNNAVTLSYVGNHGYDNFVQNTMENAYCVAGCPFGPIANTVPTDPRFKEVRELRNSGYSNYNGATVSIQRKFSHGLQAQVNYTWSHALDLCSNNCLEPFFLNTVTSPRNLFNPFNLRQNYNSSDYDARNLLNANYVWNAPSPKGRGWYALVGGWTLGGTFYFHTGYPFSVVDTGLRNTRVGNITGLTAGGNSAMIAQYLGSSSQTCNGLSAPCFTAADFAGAATQNGFGTTRRNFFRGPGFFNTDMNVTKAIKLTERFKLAVGANFFNILNHPNFDLPVNNVSSGNLGLIQATVPPPTSPYGAFQTAGVSGRLIQLNAKITF